MRKVIVLFVAAAFLLAVTGCSKRMIIPGILAGVGAGAFAGGVAYRASLPEDDSDGLFGRKSEQKAGISVLLFSGIALMLTGIIWSATTPVCEKDYDCWAGDVCEKSTKTCVPAGPGAGKEEARSAFLPPLSANTLAGADLPGADLPSYQLKLSFDTI